MTSLDASLFRELVAEANLAPSVHNVQPVRFRLAASDRIDLILDPVRTLPVADPAGRDVRLSAGAIAEGLVMALAERGLGASLDFATGVLPSIMIQGSSEPDPLNAFVTTRSSWRGGYREMTSEAAAFLSAYASEDIAIVGDVGRLSQESDAAALHFLRDREHRRELLRWMRLDRSHPDYGRDGLSADAMRMGRIEAAAAGVVLGSAFDWLDRLGLARLAAKDSHSASCAAFVLFHRPSDEDAFDSGRAFYRRWLELTAGGLALCPVSVLVDLPETNAALSRRYGIPHGSRLVSVWKIGLPDGTPTAKERLPVDELIVAGP